MVRKCEDCGGNMRQMRLSFKSLKPDRSFWKCYKCGKEEDNPKKVIKIKPTRESAEEIADLKIKLGLAYKGDRKELIKFYMQERECLFG